MNVQHISLSQLVPYSRNSKKHPKEQIDKIALQISSVGFLVPIIIDRNGIIVAGHGRYLASKALNLETVPVIVADHLTEDQVSAFRIADNKVSESEWDMPLLAFEIGSLERIDFDLKLTGFEQAELKSILESVSGPEETKDSSKESSEEETKKIEHQCPNCGFEF